MIRMPLSLEHDDKRWLDRHARSTGKSAAGILREALRAFRAGLGREDRSFQRLLDQTRGVWKRRETPLGYQRRLRREWDRRS